LAINAKGGEKILAQSKRTAPPPISKSVSICIKEVFQLVSYFWSNFKLVWPLSKLISKTLLNTKRIILLRGSFVVVKGKAFETRGENFKSWKCLLKFYSFTFDYLQKDFEKEFPKNICKTKHVVQAWSKMLKWRKQSMHILWKCKLI
jgi:hypothetical protein